MSDSDKRVEDARLEIAEMAGQAGDRAASTIATAVKGLKEEVERLFAEARRNASNAAQPASAAGDAAGAAVFDDVPGDEVPVRADSSTAGEDSPNLTATRE